MIAWVLYATLLSILFAVAAFTLERALRLVGVPGRGVWALALAASLLIPILGWRARSIPASTADVTSIPGTVWKATSQTIVSASLKWNADFAVRGIWAALSIGVAAILFLSWLRLSRERRRWYAHDLEGTVVLVSPDLGPAVLGTWQPSIVIPRWLLTAPSEVRRLALEHERSHLDAKDPALLWGATVAAVAMPWNPVLWWQLWRLRAAVELDCDQRVLAKGAAAGQYAELLLQVGTSPNRWGLGPALRPTGGGLGRRLDALVERKIRWRGERSALLGATGFLAALVACTADAPVMGTSVPSGRIDPVPTAGVSHLAEQVDDPVVPVNQPRPRYPPVLQQAGIQGFVEAQYIVDAGGVAESSSWQVLQSSHPQFETAAREAVLQSVFRPARIKNRAVRQLVQQRFGFTLDQAKPIEGSVPRIVLRCATSCEVATDPSDRAPLIVVDGVVRPEFGPHDLSALTNAREKKIDRVEVLQGAAAFALYGDRARNGVIRITTKQH